MVDSATLAIVALAVALLSAIFTGFQTYLFKRSLNIQKGELSLHEKELQEERTRFLVERRREHYGKIREIIAILWEATAQPLASDNSVTPDQLKLKFDISRATEVRLPSGAAVSGGAFKEARLHLGKDNPEFLETIGEVSKEVELFNSSTDSLLVSLREEARKRLSSIVALVEGETPLTPHSVNFPVAMRFVEGQGWFNYLARTTPLGFTIEEIISSSPVRANIEIWRNDVYMLDALIFAKGLSPDEISRLSEALASMAQDVTTIRELLERRDERKRLEASLGERLKGFSQQIHDLIYSINTNHYSTICACCPDGVK